MVVFLSGKNQEAQTPGDAEWKNVQRKFSITYEMVTDE